MKEKEPIIVVDKVRLRQVMETVGRTRTEVEPAEKVFVGMVTRLGKKLEQKEFAGNALFMVSTFVFGDDTGKFFGKFKDEADLERQAWLFQPQEILARKAAGVDVEAEVLKFLRPGGRNKKSVEQYVHNAEVIQNVYHGDIQWMFDKEDNDALKVQERIMVWDNAHTEDKPELRRAGRKIVTYYLHMLEYYDVHKFKNIHKLGIPLDFQALRVLAQCGAYRSIDGKPRSATAVIRALGPAVVEVGEEGEFYLPDVSQGVYGVGHDRCNRRRHEAGKNWPRCPLADMCSSLISRKPYDGKNGMIDFTDTGRYDVPKKREKARA